jgi:D-beta-D-heptose 7-phosphate kinase / D-beta-D-heptose 1-phosphate adenosyltransferase
VELVARVRAEIGGVDAVLLSDYSKGVLTEAVMAEVLSLARAAGTPVFANPKPASIRLYHGISMVSLNQSEAETVTGMSLTDLGAMDEAGERLMRACSAEAAIITLGGRGLALFETGRRPRHLPVVPLEVYDPCGCGDSAVAAAALARTAGADWEEAATLANLAGNAKVRKLGVVPVNRKEIENVWLISQTLGNGKKP